MVRRSRAVLINQRHCFDRLPDEIMLAICEDEGLTKDTLIRLSLISRSLYHRCLPLYIIHHGIPDPTTSSHIVIPSMANRDTREYDILSAIHMALFIPFIQNLSCTFPISGEDTHTLLHHIRRLRSLVSRLSSLDDVTLLFDRTSSCYEFERSRFDILDLLSRSFEDLLNTILSKKCKSLTIGGLNYFADSYKIRRSLNSTLIVSRVASTLKRLLPCSSDLIDLEDARGNHWQFYRASPIGYPIVAIKLSRQARQKTVLRNFSIDNSNLFAPPLLNWTTAALRHSPISSITLTDLSLNFEVRPAILLLIANTVPNLSALSLERLGCMSSSDILQFISAFRVLTSLHIKQDVVRHPHRLSESLPNFPRLTTLYAPSTWALKWLQTYPIPWLEKLTILVQKFDYRLFSILDLLARRPDHIVPSLVVIVGIDLDWILNGESDRLYETLSSISITHISLIFGKGFREDSGVVASVLPLWLRRFTGIRHLLVDGHHETIEKLQLPSLIREIVRQEDLSIRMLTVSGQKVDLQDELLYW